MAIGLWCLTNLLTPRFFFTLELSYPNLPVVQLLLASTGHYQQLFFFSAVVVPLHCLLHPARHLRSSGDPTVSIQWYLPPFLLSFASSPWYLLDPYQDVIACHPSRWWIKVPEMATKPYSELYRERFRGKLGHKQAYRVLDPGFSRLCRRAWIFQFREYPGLRYEEGRGVGGMELQGEKRCVLMMVSLQRNGKAQRDSLCDDGNHSPESSAISSYAYSFSRCSVSSTLNRFLACEDWIANRSIFLVDRWPTVVSVMMGSNAVIYAHWG